MVNDLNYLIKTPDRRKSKQLCHINTIKLYHDRTEIVYSKVESDAAVNTKVMTLDQNQCSQEYDQSTPSLYNSNIFIGSPN